MRKWINIINEGIVGWENEMNLGYERFEQRWEDHVDGDSIEDCPLLDFDTYMDYATEMAEELGRIALYRGMRLRPDQLESIEHLGVHWSRSWDMAKDFSHSGWSMYDTRFTKPGEGAIPVIIAIAPVHPDQADMVETLAVSIYGGEDEVCMKQNQPVKIVAVYINRVMQEDHPLIGQTRLT